MKGENKVNDFEFSRFCSSILRRGSFVFAIISATAMKRESSPRIREQIDDFDLCLFTEIIVSVRNKEFVKTDIIFDCGEW